MSANKSYEIIKLNAPELSENEVQVLYSAHSHMVKKYGFLNRIRNADEYKDNFLSEFDGEGCQLFVLKENGIICGILTFEKGTDWGGNEQYELGIKLCSKEINPELTDCLRHFIHKKLGLHDFIAISVYGELDELINEFSAKIQLTGNTYTLDKADINVDTLEETAETIQAKNPGLRIQFMDIVPEEHIEQYCNLFNELMDDMPDVAEARFVQYIETPENQVRRNQAIADGNAMIYRYVIFDESNRMIAQSNVNVGKADTKFPYQFLIGVTKQYRGKNLGKWLYAAMYQKLFNDVDFEKSHVAHHPTNKHAIAISEWVGYKFAYPETTYILTNNRNSARIAP